MYVLRSGAFVDQSPQGTFLRYLSTGGSRLIDRASSAEVVELALGLHESTPLVSTLIDEGWVHQAESACDPVLAATLERLCLPFAWTGATRLPAYMATLDAHAGRRRLMRSLGQYPALPETVARRAALIGAPSQRVLVLGDDDLLGIALAHLGHEVTVLEADAYIVEYERRYAKAHKLELDVRRHDLRSIFPADLRDTFDVCFCDPMSSATGLALFADRAMAGLKIGGRLWICVTDAARRVFDTHRRSTKIRFATHCADFNHYYTSFGTLSPYVSDMFGMERVEATTPMTAAHEPFVGVGMFDEERYGLRNAVRYVIKDIRTDLSELLHLKLVVDQVADLAGQPVENELAHWHETYRTYVAVLPFGRLLAVTLRLDERRLELLISPPDDQLQLACESALLAAYGSEDSKARIVRLRDPMTTSLGA